jgi:hypothetical protein
VAVAAILERESLALNSRRCDTAAVAATALETEIGTCVTAAANGEIAAAVTAASALHADGVSTAAATAANGSAAAAMAASVDLGRVLVATLPAAISAGLRACRRRNRQCGDARG